MKIIITGASGWLGRNSIRYFLNRGIKLENLILIGSHKRDLEIFNGINVNIETFEEVINSPKSLSIEGIVHLAYQTRDKVGENISKYISENSKITNQVCQLLESKPRWFTYVSSGAIYSNYQNQVIEVSPNSNPYGFLKHQDENIFNKFCGENSINISIGRLWGASGIDFINPNKYAFGEFILKSLANQDIEILSPRKVFRKFCDSEQFIEICIRSAQQSPLTVFNSSGELIEIEDLANLIVNIINSKSQVRRKYLDLNADSDNYFSLDEDYFNLAKDLGINLLGLREQVIKTSAFLIKSLKTLT